MKNSTTINLFLALLLISLLSCRKDIDVMDIEGIGPIEDGDYYVATWGNDTNSGSFDKPWATWQKAFETAEPGDVVYFRGGVWYPVKQAYGNNITMIHPTYWGPTRGVGHNGTYEKPICYLNYPGETPILDCSQVDIAGHEFNSGIDLEYVSFLKFRGLTVRNVKQTKINEAAKVASGIGAWVCSNLTFENCTVHNVGGRGFAYMSANGYYGIQFDTTRFINCDSYNNADMLSPVPGNAADGWKCDNEPGAYFIFKGCRAWNNTDDGFDVSGCAITVFDNCWSFSQGFEGAMDGTGFKFGAVRGAGATLSDGVLHIGTPVPGVLRVVKNCLSAFNYGSGFGEAEYDPYYRNNSRIYNNTLYKNNIGISISSNTINPNSLSVYKNNLVYNTVDKDAAGRPYNLSVVCYYTESHNTWDFADATEIGSIPWWKPTDSVTVSDNDFISLNPNELTAPRKADGSLPDIKFLNLKDDSPLKSAGTYVGFSHNAPIGIDWDYLRSRK